MKEMIYTQSHPTLGELKGVLRIVGKILFYKFNNKEQAATVISQLQSRGAKIQVGKEWIMVDMFVDRDLVKLGSKEFNPQTTSEEEVEGILFDFYYNQFTKMKFKVDVI
jgi:hypothetical protein